jgi:hypothetical protein
MRLRDYLWPLRLRNDVNTRYNIPEGRRRVYVAGAYSADNILDIFQNMRIGINTATRLFANGFSPFCPWIDYHYLMRE